RYGKVYYYDRMGNREPSEADRIRGALDNFDAPRFRPPENVSITKRYDTRFSPLSSPAPIEIPSSSLLIADQFPNVNPLPRGDSIPSTHSLPPHLMNIPHSLKEDAHPSDPMQPRTLDPLYNLQEGVDMGIDVDRRLRFSHSDSLNGVGGVMKDLDRFRMDDGEIGMREEGIRMEYRDDGGETDSLMADMRVVADLMRGLGGKTIGGRMGGGGGGGVDHSIEFSHSREEEYGEEVCAQCRAEEKYMEMMRRKAEEEDEKRKLGRERANRYESDLLRKEEEVKKEEMDRRRALEGLVDKVNNDLVGEYRRRAAIRDMPDAMIFRQEDDNDRRRLDDTRKELFAKTLEGQIDEGRRRRLNAREKDDEMDIRSNHRAAREYAEEQRLREKEMRHARESEMKSLQFQMEMNARRRKMGGGGGDEWWIERPDEHGWREARLAMKGKERQLEKNYHLQENIDRLEEFKRRQEQEDRTAKEAENIRYARLRDKIHEQNDMMREYDEFGKRRARKAGEERNYMTTIDPRVEQAWKEAHEKNDKRYRVLQESEGRIAIGEGKTTHCKRCVRCARPLAYHTA
ncbi:hypothetical protein PENTCL1PPCAC_6696, partial [Pristionchus entomophagus]